MSVSLRNRRFLRGSPVPYVDVTMLILTKRNLMITFILVLILIHLEFRLFPNELPNIKAMLSDSHLLFTKLYLKGCFSAIYFVDVSFDYYRPIPPSFNN